jgi:hypothetical protein
LPDEFSIGYGSLPIIKLPPEGADAGSVSADLIPVRGNNFCL